MDLDAALTEYDYLIEKKAYDGVVTESVRLLSRLLGSAGIKPHSINPRIKSRDSLKEKLQREGKTYSSLSDVKDIVGVRIITYFEDELKEIDEVLKAEFVIHPDDSYDRRSKLADDQFGYRSIHYICSFKDNRLALGEYAPLKGHVVEIQTRSILQHAWAEIEHEFYKTKGPKPEQVRRRNSRLAGLLELADDEFIAIRKEMETYRKNVDLRIDADENLENVKLDIISIMSFISQEPIVAELDQMVADDFKVTLTKELSQASAASALKALASVGIESLEQLRATMRERANEFRSFASKWADQQQSDSSAPRTDQYNRGVSVYQFGIYLSALRGIEKLKETFDSVVGGPVDSNPPLMEMISKLAEFATAGAR